MKVQRLFPVCKNYIWGGTRLKDKYGKKTDDDICAESWELSVHKDGESRIADGRTLGEALSPAQLGKNVADLGGFPMLIKFIDAQDDLSVQVHPSDEYAMREENSFGKTEMWYIVEAEDDAGIYLGFNRDVTLSEYKNAISEGRLTELLNFYPVKAGEAYFIPSGTIHAICRGTLICEIQQNSNLTYRVYDHGRLGKDGRPRELHIDKALAVTSLKKYIPQKTSALLAANKYFTVRKLDVHSPLTLFPDANSFRCVSCVRGEGNIDGEKIKLGDSFFIPAGEESVTLSGDMSLILSEVRKYTLSITVGNDNTKAVLSDDLGRVIAAQSDTSSVDTEVFKARLLSEMNMTDSDIQTQTYSEV